VGETTGPSPACSVCTWVSVTLNGVSTLTFGAAVSVEPVTATLPVVPSSVHSGVPPPGGAAVGHVLAAAGVAGVWAGAWVSVIENGSAGATEDVLVEDEAAEPESEPHAASVVTSNVAPAASVTDEDTREKFTVVTLQNDESLRPRRSTDRKRVGR
jgi:hypothetical protein